MPAPQHTRFLQDECPSCRPTNSIKALKAQSLTKMMHSFLEIDLPSCWIADLLVSLPEWYFLF